jgi:hypothetical protein
MCVAVWRKGDDRRWCLRVTAGSIAFFTDDVLWTTVETGDRVQGREAVRDFIITLHTKLFDAHPELKSLAIGDGIVGLEADFVGTHTGEFAGLLQPAPRFVSPTPSSTTSGTTASKPFAATYRSGKWWPNFKLPWRFRASRSTSGTDHRQDFHSRDED